MNFHVNRSELAADSVPHQLAVQHRRAEKTRQRVRKLREKAFAEIERLIAFLDASDGYTMDEREEAVDDVPCDDRELEFSFCGVTADKCSMPHSEYDDEMEAAYGNGREADDEPSLGSCGLTMPDDQTYWARGGIDDREDEHDGSEPDLDAEDDKADDEPSLGWLKDGSFINDDDREAGGPARPPQNRTDLNTTIAVECTYRKFIHGLTGSQRMAVKARLLPDSGVVVR
jgi:hypothetical protein